MLKSNGPVKATYEFESETLGPVVYTCTLEGLELEMVINKAEEYRLMQLEELLDTSVICFGPETVKHVLVKETKLVKQDDDRWGRMRKVK